MRGELPMMGRRLPAKGEEFDATTGWRRVYKYLSNAGVRASIKRRLRRRERRFSRHEIAQQLADDAQDPACA